MKKSVVLITHPRHEARLRRLTVIMEGALPEFVFVLMAPPSVAAIGTSILQWSPESCHGVVVAGGDGTIHHALGALMASGLPLYIWPLGTGNDFAKELGMTAAIPTLVAALRRATLRRVDLVSVNGRPFATVAGLGLSAKIVKCIDDGRCNSACFRFLVKLLRGNIYTLVTVFLVVFSPRPTMHLVIRTDEEELREESLTLFVLNTRRAGGGLIFEPDALYDDGALDLVNVTGRGRFATLIALWQIATQRRPSAVTRRRCRSAALQVVGDKAAYAYADGEVLDAHGEWSCQILPGALIVFDPSV